MLQHTLLYRQYIRLCGWLPAFIVYLAEEI